MSEPEDGMTAVAGLVWRKAELNVRVNLRFVWSLVVLVTRKTLREADSSVSPMCLLMYLFLTHDPGVNIVQTGCVTFLR